MSLTGGGDGALASSSHPMSLTGGGDGAPASSPRPMSLSGGGDGASATLALALAVKPYERYGVHQSVTLRSSLEADKLEALLLGCNGYGKRHRFWSDSFSFPGRPEADFRRQL